MCAVLEVIFCLLWKRAYKQMSRKLNDLLSRFLYAFVFSRVLIFVSFVYEKICPAGMPVLCDFSRPEITIVGYEAKGWGI